MANEFGPEGEQRDVFGSGDASEKIMKIIEEKLKRQSFFFHNLDILVPIYSLSLISTSRWLSLKMSGCIS